MVGVTVRHRDVRLDSDGGRLLGIAVLYWRLVSLAMEWMLMELTADL